MTPEERQDLFRLVFGSEAGRAALTEIEAYCGVGGRPFRAESDRLTVYNLGKQDAGLWIREQTQQTQRRE